MTKTAAYPGLHGASVDAIREAQPLSHPELGLQMVEWAKRSCRRAHVPMPKGADPFTVLKALRVLAAKRAERRPIPFVRGASTRDRGTSVEKRAREKAWNSGYSGEYQKQKADITYFLWWGWWKD